MNDWIKLVDNEFKLLGITTYITYNNTAFEVLNGLKKLSIYCNDDSGIPRYRKMTIPNIDGSIEDDLLTDIKFKELLKWIEL